MRGFCCVVCLTASLCLLVTSKAMGCGGATLEWQTMLETQVTLRSKEGVTQRLDAKIAKTPRQRAAGFQHICPDFVRRWAILFVFPNSQQSSFHMQNVKENLEIIFINEEGRLLEIQQMTREQKFGSREIYQAGQAYQYALEAKAGRLSALGLMSADWWLVLESWGI